jgi:hypothetical protein
VSDFPRPAIVGASASSRSSAPVQPIRPASPRPEIPRRYALRDKDGGPFLECDEAPRVRAIIDPQMSVSRSAAASLGDRVILLDGAGSFGPLIDNDEKLYNLDHHAGCERLFTLSTCEQALLLVHSGLDLSEGDWKIFANDPDLDTVLALWCLLNFRRVRELGPEARDVLLPLLRLEGAIDANGPKLAALCGLSNELLETTSRRVDHLLARERELKQSGSWAKKKLYPYTLEMLCAVDELIFAREDFGDYTRIDEVYGHVEVGNRCVAVVCRDRSGIYTVEQHLKTRWGDQLSLIALENEPGHYTLRRVSTLAGPKLGPAYNRLNRMDAAVDGLPPGKQWGGSEDIGGSPRPTGTLLTHEDLVEQLERAYRPLSWWARTRKSVGAFLVGLFCLTLAWLAEFFPSPFWDSGGRAGIPESYTFALGSLLVLTVGMLLTRSASQRRPWVFGWRKTVNGGGWGLLPLAMLGAAPAAVWASESMGTRTIEFVAALGAGIAAIAAGEVWFRGLVHGMLVPDFAVQRPLGGWLLSRAAITSAAAYAVVATMMTAPVFDHPLVTEMGPSSIELGVGAATIFFATGLALAVLRERSMSFLPGLYAQVVGLGLAALVYSALV